MATSHPEFSKETEGVDVAKAFPDGIRNKTIIVTGANRNGIGFATSHAFVSYYIMRPFSSCICSLTSHTGLSVPSLSDPGRAQRR